MYDHLVGELIERQATRAVVRTAGVGYEIRIPTGCLRETSPGSQVCLYTILNVLDGVPSLLGFTARNERELARRLLAVAGVGPAMTIAILSTYSPVEFAGAVLRDDHTALRRIKGVGGKTAERLCVELRDQIHKLDLGPTTGSVVPSLPQSQEDAVAALVTLGYSEKEAREKVRKISAASSELGTEDLVKAILRGG